LQIDSCPIGSKACINNQSVHISATFIRFVKAFDPGLTLHAHVQCFDMNSDEMNLLKDRFAAGRLQSRHTKYSVFSVTVVLI
jgi:hypothetical protein